MSLSREAGANPLAASGALKIYNLTLTDANTEYLQVLPTNCRKFSIRSRNSSHVIKLAFKPNESGSTYLTLDGVPYSEDLICISSFVLYMQSPTAGAVVEIMACY